MNSQDLLSVWQRTQSPTDFGKYLDALVEEGKISAEKVGVAAGFFHPGARASSVGPARLTGSHRDRLFAGLSLLSPRTNVVFAVRCVERSLHYWRIFRPGDERVPGALAASRAWLDTGLDQDLERHVDAVSAAVLEIEDLLNGAVPGPDAAYAMSAAHAASNTALAAAEAAAKRSRVPNYSSSAAKLAMDGAQNHLEEARWQVEELVRMLLSPAAIQ